MKLLALSLLLLSTSVFAEDIDLSKDAMYYCTETSSAQIYKNKSAITVPSRLTLKVKGGVVTISANDQLDRTWAVEDVELFSLGIRARDLDNIFTLNIVGNTGEILLFKYFRSWYTESTNPLEMRTMQISVGTCTKW